MTEEITRAMLKTLYQPPKGKFVIVDAPPMPYLALDGEGDPQSDGFQHAVKWIWTAVFPLRKLGRERMGRDFIEPPLECLWHADDMADLARGVRENWKWRLMIPAPPWAREDMYAPAVKKAEEKLGPAPESLRLCTLEEGRCAQILHVGPPEELPAVAARLYKEFLPQNSLVPNGLYHEIYLNDFARVAPEKRKTLLRQPVREADDA